MSSLKSRLWAITLCVSFPFLVVGQEDWVQVFTDHSILNHLAVDDERIVAVGHDGSYNATIKALDTEGNVLWERKENGNRANSYTDVIILIDGTILAGGWFNGFNGVGSYAGINTKSFDESGATLENRNLGGLKGPRGISKLALVGEDRHLFASAGRLIHYRLTGDGVTQSLATSWYGPGGFGPDFEHLEVWEDSLAIRTSNDLDSILLFDFSGNYFGGVGYDQDISDTEMKEEELWFLDKNFLYLLEIPALTVEAISALPAESLGTNLGLQWVAHEERFFLFQRYHTGGSQFWYFDPATGEWENAGQLEIPNAQLRNMIPTEEGFFYTGTYPDVFGNSNGFIGKTSDLNFQLPFKNTDLAISAELIIADTSTNWDPCCLSDAWFTLKAEVTITNLGPEPVDQVLIESEPYLADEYIEFPPNFTPVFATFRDTIDAPLLPGETVVRELQGAVHRFLEVDPIYFWAQEFDLCFQLQIPEYWGDIDLTNNKSCGEAVFEFTEEPEALSTQVFPNPAEEVLYLRGNPDRIKSWTIFNTTGQELLAKPFTEPVAEDEFFIPPNWHGLYWIRIKTTAKTEWLSFVVR